MVAAISDEVALEAEFIVAVDELLIRNDDLLIKAVDIHVTLHKEREENGLNFHCFKNKTRPFRSGLFC